MIISRYNLFFIYFIFSSLLEVNANHVLDSNTLRNICLNRFILDYANPLVNSNLNYALKFDTNNVEVLKVFNVPLNGFVIYRCRIKFPHENMYYYCINYNTGLIVNGNNILLFNQIVDNSFNIVQKSLFHYLINYYNEGNYLIFDSNLFKYDSIFLKEIIGKEIPGEKEDSIGGVKIKRNSVSFKMEQIDRLFRKRNSVIECKYFYKKKKLVKTVIKIIE
jgi:hypothetical protein